MTAPDAITTEAERLMRLAHEHGWGRSTVVTAIAAAIRKAVEEEREACAMLHESVSNECDYDRQHDFAYSERRRCGCGAMGAVIEYRDAIRARGGSR